MPDTVTNIVIAGLGGQGVLTASDILGEAAFRLGLDVKKAEVHGMSQRGGSVASDVRFGRKVYSPMVPPGEADFLVAIAPDQVEVNRPVLKPRGVVISADRIDVSALGTAKAVNVSLLGILSSYLDIPEATWTEAIKANFPEKHHEANLKAFAYGRSLPR